MFQETIQDVLAIADAGPRPEELLEALRARIAAFERFEGGEIVARTESGLVHFVIAPGLGTIGPKVLEAVGAELTLRIDTAADLKDRGLAVAGLSSLLVLHIEAAGASAAALVLGHSRAWSFAAAPLARIRTLGSLTLRLLMRSAIPPGPGPEAVKLNAENARLRNVISGLENEIVALRAERAAKKGSDTPQ